MIRKDSVDKIFETARIEEVVGDFVQLKKRGVNLIGLCPFHNEKTPSFNVNPARNIFKCFGCGKGGTSVNFIMEHEHCSYPEALRYIAKKYNIEIEEEFTSPEQGILRDEKESMLALNAFAQKYFSEQLFDHEDGKAIGLAYFKERGFSTEMMKKFQLGYSLNEWDAFSNAAQVAGFQKEYLVKTGLSIAKESPVETNPGIPDEKARFIDRFRGRVMFPIHNLVGRVIAFGGRILKKDDKVAKYINSPESEVYHKSNVLYGIYFAKNAIIKHDNCYLVEGYTDVISLHQADIENVVATSGTALTVEQIRLIRRYTKNITILYDGDPAGIKASMRGIDLVLEEGLNVKVVLFPDGDDPDSYSRKHSNSEVHDFITSNAKDFVLFKTNLLLDEVKNDPVRKVGLIHEILESISKIPDLIARTIYVNKCADLLGINEQTLIFELNKVLKNKFYSKHKVEFEELEPEIQNRIDQTYDLTASLEVQEKEIIRILLNYSDNDIIIIDDADSEAKPDIAQLQVKEYITEALNGDELYLDKSVYKDIYNHFNFLAESKKKYDINHFLNIDDDEIRNTTINLTTSEYQLADWGQFGINTTLEKDILGKAVSREIHRFKLKKIMIRLDNNSKHIEEHNKTEKIYTALLEEHKALLTVRGLLANALGRVILR